MSKRQHKQIDDMQDAQFEREALSTAQEEAVRQEVTENANLLRELRRAGIDTEKYDFLEGLLGPETAASHAIGSRSRQYDSTSFSHSSFSPGSTSSSRSSSRVRMASRTRGQSARSIPSRTTSSMWIWTFGIVVQLQPRTSLPLRRLSILSYSASTAERR